MYSVHNLYTHELHHTTVYILINDLTRMQKVSLGLREHVFYRSKFDTQQPDLF